VTYRDSQRHIKSRNAVEFSFTAGKCLTTQRPRTAESQLKDSRGWANRFQARLQFGEGNPNYGIEYTAAVMQRQT
jgi:hypothetical protein